MSNDNLTKVLIVTYYWPPSSGSGVQRWMYFAKYLSAYGITPIILTVDPDKASYRKTDQSFNDFIQEVQVYRTKTLEPLKLYSLLTTGSTRKGIPQGTVGADKKGLFSKVSRYIRGNVFIPDARIGWKKYAVKEAKKIIKAHNIELVITTGPPHSTHLIGRVLHRLHGVKWIADLRDPWTEIYYKDDLLQSEKSQLKDRKLEQSVLEEATSIITIGPSMAELLSNKIPSQKEKVRYIYNGYDAHKTNMIQAVKSKDNLVISFVGLLTDAMPHTSFSQALRLFKQQNKNSKIKLRLVGDICDSFLDVLKSILQPDQLEIVGYVAHKAALQFMHDADILFTCLPTQEHSKIMISGKILEYMATGNSILCIGDKESDAAHILAKSDNSTTLAPEEIDTIKQFIENKYNLWEVGKLSPTVTPAIKNLSRQNTTAELAQLIKSIL